MKLSAVFLVSLIGAAAAAPAAEPVDVEVRAAARDTMHSGAEIVSKLAAMQGRVSPSKSKNPLQARPADPNACYADCILAGGNDWECICKCVACGGKTPPP
ncbi:hypothetical protein GGTG_03420 [Gaeumannomyces tritici R3-111a-1]|uniref:Invertebrate defensins family profile domain-containing protein n=1 Tax=Gaeumannomyces tritici (strain R3-111a-1) TaxID=644352 RepID=J3NQ63_GAET3|nr:hypothetical protein GGTG_03420 [Gaeumannomyces tritici R3-111a-1]EJT78319.1 hypothetical protein GGTG_03420 [Gaeumannomyces tritici R3-111a-1]